tara:strand:+ start:103 stop:732 length:630 start_codon:yes stop_codon:yes gene_type:complete
MKYDSTTNIIILGEHGVGKSTLIHNYLYNNVNRMDNTPTIGIDYYKKVVYNNGITYVLNIWDTGNGLLYKNILEHYLIKSEIFIIVLKNKSFRFVNEVFETINSNVKIKPKYIFIVYNKYTDICDFTFDEEIIITHNPKNSIIYFSYINLYSNYEVNNLFNKIKLTIYDNYDNNNLNRLIPLNIKDNTIPEKTSKNKHLCGCDSCCIIS